MVVLGHEMVDVRRLQPAHVGDVQVREVEGSVVIRRVDEQAA